MELSQKEKDFILGWKRLLGKVPRDWTQKQIESGTSDFLNWRNWLSKDSTIVSLALDCVGEYVGRDRLPSYAEIQKHYNIKCRKTRRDLPPPRRCEACANTGVLFVPCYRDPHGRTFIVTKPIPAPTLFENTVPCLCSKGTQVMRKQRWEVSDVVRKKAMRAALLPSQFQNLRRRCRELAGLPVTQAPLQRDPDFERILRGKLEKYAVTQSEFVDDWNW